MTDEQRLGEAVRELAGAVIADRKAALSAAGLHATVEVKRWSNDSAANSELRIAFWRANAFVDVIEDFIVQDGVSVASLDEFRRWLGQGVDAIVQENSGR